MRQLDHTSPTLKSLPMEIAFCWVFMQIIYQTINIDTRLNRCLAGFAWSLDITRHLKYPKYGIPWNSQIQLCGFQWVPNRQISGRYTPWPKPRGDRPTDPIGASEGRVPITQIYNRSCNACGTSVYQYCNLLGEIICYIFFLRFICSVLVFIWWTATTHTGAAKNYRRWTSTAANFRKTGHLLPRYWTSSVFVIFFFSVRSKHEGPSQGSQAKKLDQICCYTLANQPGNGLLPDFFKGNPGKPALNSGCSIPRLVYQRVQIVAATCLGPKVVDGCSSAVVISNINDVESISMLKNDVPSMSKACWNSVASEAVDRNAGVALPTGHVVKGMEAVMWWLF